MTRKLSSSTLTNLRRILEEYFFLVLSTIVKQQDRIKSVKYVTSGEHCERLRFIASSNQSQIKKEGRSGTTKVHKFLDGHEIGEVVLQVNSPAFYANFFHYKSPFDAFQSEMLDDERTRTVWSSHPDELLALFQSDYIDFRPQNLDWRWKIVSAFRTSPLKTNFPRRKDFVPFKGVSMTDTLIMQNCSKGELCRYRRALLRLFLGDLIGGFSIGSIKQGNFELVGLSRDAILSIQDAFLRSLLISVSMCVRDQSDSEQMTLCKSVFLALAMSLLNIWALLKLIL